MKELYSHFSNASQRHSTISLSIAASFVQWSWIPIRMDIPYLYVVECYSIYLRVHSQFSRAPFGGSIAYL